MWEAAAIAAGAGALAFAGVGIYLALAWRRDTAALGDVRLELYSTEQARKEALAALETMTERAHAVDQAFTEQAKLLAEKDALIEELGKNHPGAGRRAFDAPPAGKVP